MHHILEDWGDLDIIINNAGISKFASLTETSVEDFDQTLSANLRPAFITSRLLAIHRQSQTTPIRTAELSTYRPLITQQTDLAVKHTPHLKVAYVH